MTDKQQPILVLGKEYVPNPAPPRGCVGFDNSELCEALPSCNNIIFVERKLEVSVLCDQARADGYAKGMAAKQAEWDKWQADRDAARARWLEKYPTLARTSDPATSHKAAQGMGRKAGLIADLILVELQGSNLTGSMLAERTGVALNSITPRFAQLFREGLIHAVGVSGRETVWAIGNGIPLGEAPKAPPKQPAPNDQWCGGCSPDNCSGCGVPAGG